MGKTKTNKLLMVEDKPIQREAFYQVMEDEIESKKYALNFADDVRSALNYLNSRAADLIVLDLALNAAADGFNVLEAINDKKIATRVLVLTGHPQRDNVDRALQLGAYDFVPKPYYPDEIRQKIQAAIATPKMNRSTRNRQKMTFHQILTAINQLSAAERYKIAEKVLDTLPKTDRVKLISQMETVLSGRGGKFFDRDPLDLDFTREDIVELAKYKYGSAHIEYRSSPYKNKDGSVQKTGPYAYLRYVDGVDNVSKYLELDHPAVKKDLLERKFDLPPGFDGNSIFPEDNPVIKRIDEFVPDEQTAINLVKALVVKYPKILKQLKIY